MKKFSLFLLAALSLGLVACEPKNQPEPEPEPAPLPTSFPRKHLIEHFTGETCGYCPYGMESIESFLASTNKNYIWVSHHYGYGTDEYTITENSTIGKKLGVSGAPNVVFDRTKRKVNGTTAYAFHPGYLTETGAVPLNDADTAVASVVIKNTYDAASRKLTVEVSGQTVDDLASFYLLSVLVKENGLVGSQYDYYNTYEGWSQFRHNKTVRDFLTAAMGDQVTIDKNAYSATYEITLPAKWNADNCVVVAYITESASTVKPIINAEQAPVIAGQDAGESLKCEGITRVPVSDTYPEEGAPLATITFTQASLSTTNQANYGYDVLTLTAPNTSVQAGGYSCYPYLQLYVFTETKALAAGTYPISEDAAYGVVAAGYRDDTEYEINGSMLYYVYNYSGSLYPMAQWLLRSGNLVVGEDGSYTVTVTTLNGSTFTGSYTPATAAPARSLEDLLLVKPRENRFGFMPLVEE